MSNEWLDMVLAAGIDYNLASNSPDELDAFVSSSDVQLSDVSTYRIYEVTGADATAFLQGQFCNDIAQVSPMQAQITGYCTPKGRLLALPVITGFDGGYRMLVPADVSAAFIKRLSMFVMRSDVAIKALEDWVAIGVIAPSDTSEMQFESVGAELGALPVGVLSVASSDNMQLVRWHDDNSGSQPRARYLRLAPVADQMQFWQANAQAEKRSSAVWRLADISAGIPSITEGVVEAFVPQMINLQLINGLSFTKGCYPGQEIVARMQYLGKLKRHMRVFRLSLDQLQEKPDSALIPGKALCSGLDDNAGIVVDAMPLSSRTALVLAVTKVNTASGDGFSLAGASLEPMDMPYELPSLEVA
ncbi:MAG: folate-binding protein YgfZ [Granulosicoccus sp.]